MPGSPVNQALGTPVAPLGTGFWLAWADADGARNPAAQFRLHPAPVGVEYPKEALGQIVDTPDGGAIQQQPAQDPRRRAWLWKGYPSWLVQYRDLWDLLEGTRSRYRRELGLSPYVYLKEDQTGLLRRRDWRRGTLSGTVDAATFTDAAGGFTPGTLYGAAVEFPTLGRRGVIAANTAQAFTLVLPLDLTPPAGTPYVLKRWVDDWFRVRVLDVTRTVKEGSGDVVYDDTKLVFVIDDAQWNGIG